MAHNSTKPSAINAGGWFYLHLSNLDLVNRDLIIRRQGSFYSIDFCLFVCYTVIEVEMLLNYNIQGDQSYEEYAI